MLTLYIQVFDHQLVVNGFFFFLEWSDAINIHTEIRLTVEIKMIWDFSSFFFVIEITSND